MVAQAPRHTAGLQLPQLGLVQLQQLVVQSSCMRPVAKQVSVPVPLPQVREHELEKLLAPQPPPEQRNCVHD